MKIITHTSKETIMAGEEFGESLQLGSVVAFSGVLGAGKTTFIKGVAHSLGITDDITSPTFCLINEYKFSFNKNQLSKKGSVIQDISTATSDATLYHIDAYRLNGPEDFYNLGSDDFLYNKDAIVLIEWSENILAALPNKIIKVNISINADGNRIIEITR